ncbi:MAG: hypothetical protein WCK42_09430 [Myxococcaceae bacterium]
MDNLEELSKAYQQDLPAKIAYILSLWKSLEEGPWNPETHLELYHLVHNLAGVGAMFNCAKAGEIAARLGLLLYPKPEDKKAIAFVMREFEQGSWLPIF